MSRKLCFNDKTAYNLDKVSHQFDCWKMCPQALDFDMYFFKKKYV